MPKFFTQFDPPKDVIQNPGSRIKILYGPIFDKNGIMSLQEIGTHDLYSEIQSHADSVDIYVLLKRYQQGDIGALSRVQGAYGDFTQMPKTFAEALNTMIAAEQYFNGLPVETRAMFGHSFQQFIASMDSSDWTAKLGLEPPAPAPSPAPASSAASAPVPNTEGQKPSPDTPSS